MGQTQETTCLECKIKKKCTECPKCSKLFCSSCLSRPLIECNDRRELYDVLGVCIKCWRKSVSLDMNQKITIIGKQYDPQIIFLHGGGGSRNMFLPQATIFAQKFGYRCILLDFPGHGSRMDQKLTLQACLEVILKTKKQNCFNQQVFLVGGSFGGYVGMQALGKFPQMFAGAAILMAGQNVGEGRGAMASFGLWAMEKGTTLLSEITVSKQLIGAAMRNKYLDQKILAQNFASGFYFRSSKQQITVLKSTNSEAALKRSTTPVIFMNGEKDHKDSQNKWLAAAAQGSTLRVYKDTDHFFSHDKRYFSLVIEQIEEFFRQILQKGKVNSLQCQVKLIAQNEIASRATKQG